ncbi:hypothetical protein EVAR_99901_1 [Eumeta japonica]|uniref:Uncharacterized protein n=1 Tax=Eumeta variegata TaxID=151549 RepID=A0A4C1ZVU2_EUMVA|nr:hypothetical protein EVAR_99901_1 [Eumeta japonica]
MSSAHRFNCRPTFLFPIGPFHRVASMVYLLSVYREMCPAHLHLSKLKKECVIVEFPTVAVTKVYRTNEKYCNISVTPTEVALGDAVSAICQSREEYSGLHWDVVQWTGRGMKKEYTQVFV